MNKRLCIFVPLLVLLMTGCKGLLPGGDKEVDRFTLVPGDHAGIRQMYSVTGNAGPDRIELHLFIETHDPVVKGTRNYRHSLFGNYRIGHCFPSDSVFNSYEESVKETFYNLSFNLEKNIDWLPSYSYYSTVFPIGPTTVIANKEFQGIQAGEDLSCMMINDAPEYCSEPWEHPLRINDINDFIEDMETYHNLGHFYIKLSAPKTMEEDIRFTVSIPVRKVKILHWLNDLTVSADAPMPYSEEVVSWTVTIPPYTIIERHNMSVTDYN